jgi:hypothetical protein
MLIPGLNIEVSGYLDLLWNLIGYVHLHAPVNGLWLIAFDQQDK